MSRHTPGPWKIHRRSPREEKWTVGTVIRGDRNRLIAQVGVIRPEVAEEAAANARLIATAPELYFLLERLIDADEMADVASRERSQFLKELAASARGYKQHIDGGI